MMKWQYVWERLTLCFLQSESVCEIHFLFQLAVDVFNKKVCR